MAAEPVADPVCVAGPDQCRYAGLDDGGKLGEEGAGVCEWLGWDEVRGWDVPSPVAVNLLYGPLGHSWYVLWAPIAFMTFADCR